MKLITKEIEERFAEIGDQSQEKNPLVVAKFFNPVGAMTWYATEYEPDREVCFGYVTGFFEDEWGTFSIKELESVQLPLGLRIERDLYFREIRFNELMRKLALEQSKTIDISKEKEIDQEELEL